MLDRIRDFLLCSEFRSAVQLTTGKSCSLCFAMRTTTYQHQQLLPAILPLLSELVLYHSLFLCAGQLVVALFVFINKLTYSNSCLSSIFYVAASVLVPQDAHVGSKMNAAAFIIGPLWFGSVLAGCMVRQNVSCTSLLLE